MLPSILPELVHSFSTPVHGPICKGLSGASLHEAGAAGDRDGHTSLVPGTECGAGLPQAAAAEASLGPCGTWTAGRRWGLRGGTGRGPARGSEGRLRKWGPPVGSLPCSLSHLPPSRGSTTPRLAGPLSPSFRLVFHYSLIFSKPWVKLTLTEKEKVNKHRHDNCSSISPHTR